MTLLLPVVGALVGALLAALAAVVADRDTTTGPDTHTTEAEVPSNRVHRATVLTVGGLAGAALAARLEATGRAAGLGGWLVLAGVGAVLAVVDLREHRLPDRLVLPAYPALAVALAVGAVASGEPSALLRAALGGAALYAVYFVLAFVNPNGLGFGDVKLAGLLGAALGFLSWSTWVVGAVAGFWIGAVAGVVVLVRRGRGASIAFGPSMLLGALLAAVIQLDRLGVAGR